MKIFKTIILLFAFGGILLSANSCRKIQEDTFIKGLWKLNGMYFDTLSQNQMDVHFPGYSSPDECCVYKMDFQSDNVVFGYYLTNDTFGYVAIGNWEIVKYNQIQLKIDSFADGIFDIEKTTIKKFKLTSEDNHVKYFDGDPLMDTTVTRLEIERI
jgi:hypothetical protein